VLRVDMGGRRAIIEYSDAGRTKSFAIDKPSIPEQAVLS